MQPTIENMEENNIRACTISLEPWALA